MIHPIHSSAKKKKATKQSEFAILVQRVKLFEINGNADLTQIAVLSESIFEEWLKLKNKYRYQLKRGSRIREWLQDECEAKEEIVVGLYSVLNEKIINFIFDKNKENKRKKQKIKL